MSASPKASPKADVGDLKEDNLCLAENNNIQKMLEKNGKNEPKKEEVFFSDFVVKINRKDKEQTRVILITDKALYNIVPNDYANCKRRIDLAEISAVTASQVSDEFVVHVPEEYDYRYKSVKKDKIVEILRAVLKKFIGKKIKANFVENGDLKEVTVTKELAKMQTREEIQKRKEEGLEKHDSDAEDVKEKKDDEMTQMLDNQDKKVKLDDFELLKVLGRGSFGKVMQVKKKDTGQIYAMKILKKRAIVARNQIEHTKAERKILQSLQHPFLVTLRYAFQSKEKLYFVMDYFTGGELFFHLKQKRRFPEDVARVYVAEIGLALGHLHSLNVVYRDLKPENILLDDQGHVCLTDFGLSKDINPDEKTTSFCGTPEYLAPEVVAGKGYGKGVDWWGLGILLYELTVGIPPFYSQNVNEMYNKIQHGVLRFPPFLSEDCKGLIVALLHRDPEKRLGAKGDVEDVKGHAFFKSIDWQKLLQKKVAPAYQPNVKGSNPDNFDKTFTDEPVVDSVVTGSTLQAQSVEESTFQGFTFAQKDTHLQ